MRQWASCLTGDTLSLALPFEGPLMKKILPALVHLKKITVMCQSL